MNAGGTDADFELALTEHSARIERFCARLTNWHSDSPDLAQDVFVVAYERWDDFRGDSAVETWLMGIAVGICRNWRRKQNLKSKVLGLLGQQDSVQQAPEFRQHEQSDDLRRALAKVDQASREILVMHYLEHQSIEAIANSLNCSRSATDKRLSRARKRLADQLKDYA